MFQSPLTKFRLSVFSQWNITFIISLRKTVLNLQCFEFAAQAIIAVDAVASTLKSLNRVAGKQVAL